MSNTPKPVRAENKPKVVQSLRRRHRRINAIALASNSKRKVKITLPTL